MAKSRRNVSRRKRQQKRRKSSRRNFRKMSGGGEALTEEDKNFLLNLKWKHPITPNNPNPEYSSIQDRLNKLTDKSITWVDKESIDNAINQMIPNASKIGGGGINALKLMSVNNDNTIKNDKFYIVSTRIMNALRNNGGS
jgi:hypothetical protein